MGVGVRVDIPARCVTALTYPLFVSLPQNCLCVPFPRVCGRVSVSVSVSLSVAAVTASASPPERRLFGASAAVFAGFRTLLFSLCSHFLAETSKFRRKTHVCDAQTPQTTPTVAFLSLVCVCVCVCVSLSLSLSLSASLCGCVCLCVHVCIEYSFAQCCNAVLRRFFTAVTNTELTSFPSPSLHCVCMYVCTRMCVWLSRNRVNCGVIRYGPLCPCVSWPSLLPHTPRCLQLLRPHQLRLRDLGGH